MPIYLPHFAHFKLVILFQDYVQFREPISQVKANKFFQISNWFLQQNHVYKLDLIKKFSLTNFQGYTSSGQFI
jgi:hypothetical protein